MVIDGSTTITITLVISLLGIVLMFGIWQGRVDTKLDNLVNMWKDHMAEAKEEFVKLHNKDLQTEMKVNDISTRLTVVETQHLHNHRPRVRKVDTGE